MPVVFNLFALLIILFYIPMTLIDLWNKLWAEALGDITFLAMASIYMAVELVLSAKHGAASGTSAMPTMLAIPTLVAALLVYSWLIVNLLQGRLRRL